VDHSIVLLVKKHASSILKTKYQNKTEQMNDLIIVNSICRTGKNCLNKNFFRIRSGTFLKILKPIDCPCDKIFYFNCGFDFFVQLTMQ